MKIIYTPNFNQETDNIINFIALDSITRALEFYNDLMIELQKTKYMPYRFRKNLILNDNDVRDLIFKGYVIPFKIENDCIKILSIYKYNLPKNLKTN